MIQDPEFWMEVRRKHESGDDIFKALLPVVHNRQIALDSGVVDYTQAEDGVRTGASNEILHMKKPPINEPFEANKVLSVPNSKCPPRPVSPSVVRVLQQIMMYAVPLYSLRYNTPAMSMGWSTSCVVDRSTKQLITFGSGEGVKVPQHLRSRGCVAGDNFFAVLTDQDEVWASGGLNMSTYTNGSWAAVPIGKEDDMTNIAGNTLMLVGHGNRLASVTRAFTVRPLSALSNPVRTVIPSRHIRFMDLGYGEDYYMVGTDSVLYKTVASKKTLGTPRRVMTLSRTAVSRVASGTNFLVIIDQNGHLYTMGRNKKGQLGNGQHQNSRRKPYYHETLRHHFFIMVAAGDSHSLALTSSGVVYGAGSNENGQLGLGDEKKEVLNFTPIPLPCKCIGIAAGPSGSMFACEDGRVYTCGVNEHKQLGVESGKKIVYFPSPIPNITTGVEAYTLDFGGYRRPQGITSPAKEPLQTEEQQTPSVSQKSQNASSSLISPPILEKKEESQTKDNVDDAPKSKQKDSCGKCCAIM